MNQGVINMKNTNMNASNRWVPKHPSLSSRRQWIGAGLATCGYLVAGVLVLAKSGDMSVPKGYTRPGPITERGRAPGLQARLIAQNPGGEKTYAIIFAKGDEVLS